MSIIANLLPNSKLLRSFSLVGLESITVRVINALYFILIARIVEKAALGTYSWIITITTILTAILSAGVGKVISRKISVKSEDWQTMVASLLRFYFAISGFVAFFSAIYLFFNFKIGLVYLYVGLLQALFSVIIMVFRETNIGLSNFKSNATASILNVISKLILGILAVLYIDHTLGLLVALLASNIIMSLYYFKLFNIINLLKTNSFNIKELILILREGVPLFGVVLFDSAISRFDFLFLGSTVAGETLLGDYSFTYKVYELLWIPFVISGVVFYPKISLWCRNKADFKLNINKILTYANLIIIISTFLPFILCVFWSPVIDYITDNKYGATNQQLIEVLSLAIPFVSCIGLLWNILMGMQRGKHIFYITIIVGIFNISVNYFAIKSFGSFGAAVTNLFSNILQILLYMCFVSIYSKKIYKLLYKILQFLSIAIIFYIPTLIFESVLVKIFVTSLFSFYLIFEIRKFKLRLNNLH